MELTGFATDESFSKFVPSSSDVAAKGDVDT